MEAVIFNNRSFDYAKEKKDFESVFGILKNAHGDGAFVKYRNNSPIGGLAPAYFEAVAMGTWLAIQKAQSADPNAIKSKVIEVVQTDDFKSQVGPAANTIAKQNARIELIKNALASL